MIRNFNIFAHQFNIPVFLFFMLILLSINQLNAQEVDLFTGPIPENMVEPKYPVNAVGDGSEGWVTVNVMIDTEGKPFESIIQSSVGDESFQRVALYALNRSVFKPAMIDGIPVDGSFTMRYKFSLEEQATGAGRRFVALHKKFIKAFDADEKNRETLTEMLNDLIAHGTNNHYEYAFLNLAKYYYATLYGSMMEQMEFLESASFFVPNSENADNYLPEDTAIIVRRELFRLQVINKRYSSAVSSFQLMEKNEDEEGINAYRSFYENILVLKEDDSIYAVEGRVNENGTWGFNLFKNDIYLDEVVGDIAELKLRCRSKYVFFAFNPELDYSIPESWGDCLLEVLGKADTTFRLVQY